MSAPNDTMNVDRVRLAEGAINTIARDPHTQSANFQPHFEVRFDSRSSNQSSRHQHEARKPDSHPGYARRHPNVVTLVALIAMTIVVLCTVLPIVLRSQHDDSSKDSTNSPVNLNTASTSPSQSVSGVSTLISSSNSPFDTSTFLDPLSIPIESVTSMTPTPTSTQARLTQLQASTALTTPAPNILDPGASCTADSQCGPNICYTQSPTTYCCGPTIPGCPGSPCTDIGHTDCKSPFKCDFSASTCSSA